MAGNQMNNIKEIALKDIKEDPFSLFAKGAILVVTTPTKTNAITIAWGALGRLWNKECVLVFIKNTRFSHDLLEAATDFTVSFFDEESYAQAIAYCGTHSGKDEDKIAKSGLHTTGEVPFIKEASLVLVAHRLLANDLDSRKITDKDIYDRYYKADGSYHTMFVGELTHIYKK